MYAERTFVCQFCGKNYTGRYKASRQFCSVKCRQAYRNSPERNPSKKQSVRQKISEAQLGNRYCVGRQMSQQTKEKIKASLQEYHLTGRKKTDKPKKNKSRAIVQETKEERLLRGTRKKVTCVVCGKTLYRPKSHREQGWNPVCSRDCMKKWFETQRPQGKPILFQRMAEWSNDFAYFLGLMITDGCVRENGYINFVSCDKELSEWVRNFIAPTSPIKIETTKIGTQVFRWYITSTKLRDILSKHGIVPRKSLICRLPLIPTDYIFSFLRGVLDGDGNVDQAHRISFSTGSIGFADDLQNLLTGVGLKSTTRQQGNSYTVMLNLSSSRTFASRIYADSPFCLERKKNHFKNYLNQLALF